MYLKLLQKLKHVVLIMLSVFLIPSLSSAQVDEDAIFTNGDLEVTFATTFTNQWDDRGSGSNRNGGFFRAKLSDYPGFYSLGDMLIPGYDPTGYALAIVQDKSTAQDILKPPTDYEGIWDDRGTGSNRDGTVWRPIPPAGYVAMGFVARGPGKPPLSAVMCIKEEYVKKSKVLANIWDDAGSGGNANFSGWSIAAPQIPEGAGSSYMSPNTFVGHRAYSAPTLDVYALIIPLADTIPTNHDKPTAPKLYDFNEPDIYAEGGTVSTTYLPWYSVDDPEFSTQLKQMTESPTYRMVRRTRYRMVSFLNNQTGTEQNVDWSTTSGTSQETTDTYAEQTGITMGKSWKSLKKSVKRGEATISFSGFFTHTTESSTSWSTETTRTLKLSVPSGTAAAGYILESSYKLYREDGSVVFQGIDHRPSGTFFAVSYPSSNSSINQTNIPELKVYPTPVTLGEKVHLDIPNSEVYQIQITDLTGRTVYYLSNVQGELDINTTNLQQGMLILTVFNEKQKFERKIFIL